MRYVSILHLNSYQSTVNTLRTGPREIGGNRMKGGSNKKI